MLERIINIAPGSDYQKSPAKSGHYNRSAHFIHTMNASLNDSISLSPATAFLTSVHWRLKKINNGKEKISIVFDFGGFEFTATLERLGSLIPAAIEYEIRKVFEKLSFNYDLKLWIEYGGLFKHEGKEEVLAQLPQLSSFVSKIIDIGEYSVNVTADRTDVRESFLSMENLLRVEFNYLTGCLSEFLEKYLSLNFDRFGKKDESKSNLLLRKIEIVKF